MIHENYWEKTLKKNLVYIKYFWSRHTKTHYCSRKWGLKSRLSWLHGSWVLQTLCLSTLHDNDKSLGNHNKLVKHSKERKLKQKKISNPALNAAICNN